MSFTEIALILFVALVLFGPEDLPVIARTLGKIVGQIRRYSNELTKEFKEAINTPGTILNEAFKDPLQDTKKDTKTTGDKDKKPTEDDSEKLLTYEETEKNDESKKDDTDTEGSNPLLDLPQEIVSRPNDKQAGD